MQKSTQPKNKRPQESHNQHKKSFPEITLKIISEADIVMEILDARLWQETRNFELEKEVKKQGKKLIYVFNKSDLADRKKILEEMGEQVLYPHVFMSCTNRKGSGDLRERIKIEAKDIKKERIYVGVIGYPNTGKSSVTNILRGKSVARVASESGFTKGAQKIKIGDGIYLIDTPGVIPSTEDAKIKNKDMYKHLKINVIRWDRIKEPEMMVHYLMLQYPGVLETFYDIKADGNSEILIDELGTRKNFFLKGKEVDVDRTSRVIIRDFQDGRIRF
ncbi:MAG: GTPase [Nanoarchaeota archaeon]